MPLLGLTGLVRLRYRTRYPGQAEVVMELGPESPAIVPDRDHGSSSTFDRIDGISLAAMVLCAVALAMGRSWLGLRRFMADHGRFEDCPAAAVQIWDRYPAHAVALDLAPLAAQQLPLGAESDRWA